MKQQKSIFLLTAGLIAGILITLFSIQILGRTGVCAEAAPEGETQNLQADEGALSPETGAALTAYAADGRNREESGYSGWNSETVYVGGDQVLYNGRLYEAKWWTLGETPGAAGVWKDTGEVPASKTARGGSKAASSIPMISSPGVTPAARDTRYKEGFKVIGYFPSWNPQAEDTVRYDVLTHIVYAFAIPTEDGGLRPLENPETAVSIVEHAHKNGVKALLAVGGWSYNDVPLEPVFNAATANSERVKAFGDAIIALCNQYGFDGVDMDWEHPRVDGASAKQYEALMLYLAEKLHGQGKTLTSAVLSGATPEGNIYYDAAAHSDKVLEAVDWIHVMAYDGGDGDRHSSYSFAVACGQYWRETRKLPAAKVALGVPFYSRPGWAPYSELLKTSKNAWKTDHINYNGMDVYYNGEDTIRRKTEYAKKNLGGIMIWEISQDAAESTGHSLMSVIGETARSK